jgi:hypothetical protein
VKAGAQKLLLKGLRLFVVGFLKFRVIVEEGTDETVVGPEVFFYFRGFTLNDSVYPADFIADFPGDFEKESESRHEFPRISFSPSVP